MTIDQRPTVRRVLIITLVLNLLVMILKAVVGFLTGSLSLLSDALHSVTDSANNILGLVASRFSSPEPDREHPYGHQKYEAVGALGIAAFLGIACFEILSGAIERILYPPTEPLRISAVELWLLLIVLGINIFVAFYERHIGQKIGNAILIADAKHTMSDIWVTITVLAGLLAFWMGGARFPWLQWLDVGLAFPVALLVFSSGWSVLQDNLPWLVDEMAIAPEAIYSIAMKVEGVLNCHEIASRGVVGRQVFIEMHLIVNVTDVETSHQITEEIEAQLLEQYGPARIVIHVEPPRYYSDQISFSQSNPDIPLEES
ncbi:cation-efflux pump [Leptolyngbya sp. 'hensonii']|uniref:cation diffusion facilitator family transporter n=1 Tax=Leptolyngbya sp. 'hensonii' TaxID=1922337 RepID=UPI00094FE0C6|nr:cation diffusion facilitator family transporter [Leptolyngbya sp. 'hensonii']OLP17501.1 cation-efflux pump [Leptolyngbya sp. 'hensonii']